MTFTKPKSILITGANGMIGHDLAARFVAEGRKVVAVDRTVAEVRKIVDTAFELDIGDIHRLHDLARRHQVDAIVHCGGFSGPMVGKDNPAQLFNVNVGGTVDVCEVARQLSMVGPCRLVFCSSLTVYGDHAADGILESEPLRNRTSYPASKIAGEAIVMAYHTDHGVDAVIARIAGVYGPRRRTSCVIRSMIDNALDGRPTHLPYGQDFPRQWVYVDDIVEGLARAVDAPAPLRRIYNLSAGENPTIDQAGAIIRDILPSADIAFGPGPDPDDVTLGLLDITAAAKDLGYYPSVSLRDGIEKMVAHVSAERAVGRWKKS